MTGLPVRDLIAALAVLTAFGVNFSVVKIGVAEFPPLFLMVLRFFFIAVVFVPLLAFAKYRLPARDLVGVYWLSLGLGVVHFGLMFTGLQTTDAAVAAIAIQVQVPFSLLLARLLFGTRFGWRRGLGLVLAFAGVAVLAGAPERDTDPIGLGLVIAGALVWSINNLQMERLGALNPIAVTGWMAILALPQMLAVSLILEDGQWRALQTATALGWFSAVYQALVVALFGYGLWMGLLARHGAAQMMPWMLLVPVIGAVGGVVLLGEAVTPSLLIGGAITLAGVAIIVLRQRQGHSPL